MHNKVPTGVLEAIGQAIHDAANRRDYYRVSRLSQATQFAESLRLAYEMGASERTKSLAIVLTTVLTTEQVAGILNGLLCVEQEMRLTDDQAEDGQRLFDELGEQSPEAVSLASGGHGFHAI